MIFSLKKAHWILAGFLAIGLLSMLPNMSANASQPEASVVCSEALARQAVESNAATAKCIEKGKEAHPGWIINWSIQSTPGCSTPIRGCTYQIQVYASCPNPLCLAPDYLILDATVDCTFNVVSYYCYA